MDTQIRATCPTCGGVELRSSDIRLTVCNKAGLSWYAFDCDGCEQEIRKPADGRVIALLVSGGVRAELWEVPAEALEAHDGPPLTWDDLVDFGVALERCTDPVSTLARS